MLLCSFDPSCSEFPRDGEIGIRLVGAEVARPDASRQDIPQRDIALRDPFHYRLERLANALAGSFRCRRCPATTSTQSNGAREFPGQSIDLPFRLLGPL